MGALRKWSAGAVAGCGAIALSGAVAGCGAIVLSGCADTSAASYVSSARGGPAGGDEGLPSANGWITVGTASAEAGEATSTGSTLDGGGIDGTTGDASGNAQTWDAQDAVSSEAESPGPVASGFVAAYVGPAADAGSTCPFASDQSFVALGSATEPSPTLLRNGATQAGNPVYASCWVDADAGGFDVILNASVDGYGGGDFTASGHVTADGGTGIFGEFDSAFYGLFTDSNCTMSFTYNGVPVAVDGGAVSSGAILGHLDCPNAANTDVEGPDGGRTAFTCVGRADFSFDDCR